MSELGDRIVGAIAGKNAAHDANRAEIERVANERITAANVAAVPLTLTRTAATNQPEDDAA